MTKGRFFRALICFLVIFCLFCNYAALPSRAFGFAEATVSALGLTLFFLFLQQGFIPPPDQTIAIVQEIDESVRQYQLEFGGQIEWPDDGDDDESNNDDITDEIKSLEDQFQEMADQAQSAVEAGKDFILKIDSKLAALFKSFFAFCSGENAIPLPGEAAPEGYAYYNGVLLPEFDFSSIAGDYPYQFVYTDGTYYYAVGPENDYDLYVAVYDDYYRFGVGTTCYCFKMDKDSIVDKYTTNIGSAALWSNRGYELIWCNQDVYDSHKNLFMVGSTPLTQEKTIVYPSKYVGDLPLKIQQGEADEDDIPVPNEIDFSKIFEGQTDAVEALNKVATQLADGTMTHDQYIEMITPETSTDSGSGDNTGTGSGDGSGGSTTSPVTDIAPYGLDLKDYFPFCIPFDIYEFFSVLIAPPEAPKFYWEIQDLSGRVYPIEVDLSRWDSVAQLFRRMQLLLFIVGLAAASRKFIKW